MKKWYFLVVLVVMVFPLNSIAEDRPTGICGKCSWYKGEDGQRGYFEKIWLELEEDQRSGSISKKTGKRISRYNLEDLEVKVAVHLICFKKNCPNEPNFESIEKYVKATNKIIKSGRIESPRPIADDFSKYLRR